VNEEKVLKNIYIYIYIYINIFISDFFRIFFNCHTVTLSQLAFLSCLSIPERGGGHTAVYQLTFSNLRILTGGTYSKKFGNIKKNAYLCSAKKRRKRDPTPH